MDLHGLGCESTVGAYTAYAILPMPWVDALGDAGIKSLTSDVSYESWAEWWSQEVWDSLGVLPGGSLLELA